MKTFSTITLLFGFVIFSNAGDGAPKSKDKDEKSDIKKMEGNWTLEKWEQAGHDYPSEFVGGVKWSVKGDKYSLQMPGSVPLEEGTIKIDQTKKPMNFDLDITGGSDAGKLQVGIYKYEAGVLKICLAFPGVDKRPTDFTSTADNGNILIVVTTVKKD